MKSDSLSLVIGAVLVVAILCTLLVKGGWLIWIPVLLALAVLGAVWEMIRR